MTLTKSQKDFINGYIKNTGNGGFITGEDNDKFIKLIIDGELPPRLFAKMVKQYEQKNRTYTYLVTFTIDPKKWELNDNNYDVIESFILKTLKRRGLNILFSSIVREGSDKDHKHTHWHCAIITSKCLKEQYFSTYISTYGNIDVAATVDQTLSIQDQIINKLNYMSKQNIPKILKKFDQISICYIEKSKNWVRKSLKK